MPKATSDGLCNPDDSEPRDSNQLCLDAFNKRTRRLTSGLTYIPRDDGAPQRPARNDRGKNIMHSIEFSATGH